MTDPDITVDGRFTSDGLSVSAYDDDGNVVDETWFTWDEIDEMKGDQESDFTFEIRVLAELPGTTLPDIEACPECGSNRLSAIQASREGVTVQTGPHVHDIRTDEIIESLYTFAECIECGLRLIEDGEQVYED